MPKPPSAAPGLRLSNAHAQAILQAALDAIFVMDAQGIFLEMNAAAERKLGHPAAAIIGESVAAILPEKDRGLILQGLAQHLRTGHSAIVGQRTEQKVLRADGTVFPAEIAIIAVPNDPPLFVGFIRDITEQKKAQAHSALLLNELAHRSKNLLAVVQAIINRTLRDHTGAAARSIVTNRIGALARSHASLAADPSGAPMRKIVTEELEGFSNHIRTDGPDIMLKASAAQTLALVVHELATNAMKYGALSRQDGIVDVRWRASADDGTPFAFEWRETGGPPVTPPTRSGFGRTVLEKIAAAEFNATPSIDFLPTGLVYRFGVIND